MNKVYYWRLFWNTFTITIIYSLYKWDYLQRVAKNVKQSLAWLVQESLNTFNRLCHPLDGITNPKYKLLRFPKNNFLQKEEGTSF
jgi:hypothetical protein